ncbi:hypothetical protein ACJ41O_010751 [Fusarium nematophilum]
MPLQLRNARPDDIPAMRNVYYSAFGDTVIANRVFLSNREAADRFLAASFADELVDSHCQLLVVTSKATPDSVEEEVVAFAKWGLPGATIDDPPPVDAWPASGELAVEFFGTMARGHRKFMGSRQHYYLECICTHRDWMGKGAGSLLVRWGVERADADGLLCFLEATVKGKPVYERFGFQTVGEEVFRWPERTVVEAYMERQPSAAASMCTCEWERYACSHENKRRYINCQTGGPMADSSESPCGSVNFTVACSRRTCGRPDCNYLECMVKGWACCKCSRGPNQGHVCRQDLKPWRWDYVECGHRFCESCKTWREFEREKEMSRKKGSDGGGEGGETKEAIRKGFSFITRGLKA